MTIAAPDLLDLVDDDFKAIVDADVRGDLPPPARVALRHPTVSERWYAALVEAQHMTQASQTVRAAKFVEAKERTWADRDHAAFHRLAREYDDWRGRAAWAKRCIEERIAEAKAIRRAYRVSRTQAERQRSITAYRAALSRIAALGPDDPIEDARRIARSGLAAGDVVYTQPEN